MPLFRSCEWCDGNTYANPSVLSIRFISIEQLSPEEGEASERALDAWFEKHPEEIE